MLSDNRKYVIGQLPKSEGQGCPFLNPSQTHEKEFKWVTESIILASKFIKEVRQANLYTWHVAQVVSQLIWAHAWCGVKRFYTLCLQISRFLHQISWAQTRFQGPPLLCCDFFKIYENIW